MIAQALVKIGSGARWEDGDVINIVTPGIWFTTAEVHAWLEGTPPDRRTSPAQKEQTDVWLQCLAYNLEHENAGATEVLKQIERRGGFHTRFGFEDLRKHAVITVECDQYQHENAMLSTMESVRGEMVEVNCRAYRFTYEDILSEEILDAVRDPLQMVLPSDDAATFTLTRKV
jgi:hypothetical protein